MPQPSASVSPCCYCSRSCALSPLALTARSFSEQMQATARALCAKSTCVCTLGEEVGVGMGADNNIAGCSYDGILGCLRTLNFKTWCAALRESSGACPFAPAHAAASRAQRVRSLTSLALLRTIEARARPRNSLICCYMHAVHCSHAPEAWARLHHL